MRKISYIAIIAAIAAASCAKQSPVVIVEKGESVGICASLVSSGKWSEGEKVYLWQSDAVNGVLEASAAGKTADFTGSLLSSFDPDTKCRFLSNPAAVGSVRDGRLVLESSQEVFYSEMASPISNGDGSFHISAPEAFVQMTSSVSLTIKEGIEVKKMTVRGFDRVAKEPRPLCGDVVFNPLTAQVESLENSGDGSISLDGGEGLLEGTLSFVVSPDPQAADSLLVEFYNSEETVKKLGFVLDEALSMGVNADLGTVEVVYPGRLPACTFSVKAAEDTGTLLINNTASPTIYYTLDGSLPTTSSTVYDSSKGIDLATIGTCFVRALATKPGFDDIYTNAYVRYWYIPTLSAAEEITLAPLEEHSIGFATCQNTGTADLVLKFWADYRYSLSLNTHKVYATTEYDGYAMWFAKLWVGKGTKTRTITVNYGEGSIESTKVTSTATAARKKWCGGSAAFEVEKGKEISFTHKSNSDQCQGFALLEYGFEWPSEL